jgi:hypothetical protein
LENRIPARLTPKEGRKFGFSVGGAFLVIAGILWFWRGHVTVPVVFGSLGTLLVLAGLIVPGRLGPIYRGWMGFALLLSKITTPIFMGIVFFLVIAPMGLAMRVFGRNPVVREDKGGSYLVVRPTGPDRHSDLRRQF